MISVNGALATGCGLVGVFVGILVGYGWHASTSQIAPPEQRQLPPAAVRVETVESAPLQVELRSIGAVRAVDEAEMRSLVAGVVHSVSFSDGEDVEQGQELLRINDSETRQRLAVALANRNEAQRTYDRSLELQQRGLGTSNESERLAAELEAATAQVAALEAQLQDYVVAAPFPGRTGLRGVSPGVTIAVNDPITTVTRLDPLRIATTVPERYVGMVRDGIEVSASTPAFPDRLFTGQVVYVAPTVDAVSRTLRIEAEIPNPEGLLRPGQTLDITAIIDERSDALSVPEESVVLRGNRASVWVIRDGKALPQAVELGRVAGGRVEIAQGLNVGDQVVVRGIQQIMFPGMPANPQPMAADEEAAP